MDETLLLKMRSSPDPALVSRARHGLAEALRGAGRPPSIEAQTIATELVANAVEHASTAIEFRVRGRGGSIRIEVDDDGRGWPVMRSPDPRSESGRGLLIVDRLADRWGVDRRARDGKTMWAEVSGVSDRWAG